MKNLLIFLVLAIPVIGQQAATNLVEVSPVEGESWLNHIQRSFEETSMGKTSQLGPATSIEAEKSAAWELQPARTSAKQTVTLRGADLYRLNCRGCHGEFGLGAPPEINSVINPTKSTSAQLVLERMKNLGMDMSRAEAGQLANQSKAALLQRLHLGGTDMPPFPHLSEPEIRAIFAYLRVLAGIRGAELHQARVEESRVRLGEHIVKSTCHICHAATGPNPSAEQLFNGVIPPLSTLTTRMSLPEFQRKITGGAPVTMGAPASLFRGRMPVFYYLTKEEAADAYFYLKLFPPVQTAADQMRTAQEPGEVESKIVPVSFNMSPVKVTSSKEARDWLVIIFPTAAGLLLVGGFWFTWWEIRRLTALSSSRNAFGSGSVASHLPHPTSRRSGPPARDALTNSLPNDNAAEMAHAPERVFHHEDFYTFERSWLARWLEGKDEAA